MSDALISLFKQVVHLNLNLAILVLLAWLLLGKGRGFRTSLTVWSILLVRVLVEPWLCPESARTPVLDFSQPGFLSVGIGLSDKLETLQVLLGSGEHLLSAGDMAVMSLGEGSAMFLGLLMAIGLTASLLVRVSDLAGSFRSHSEPSSEIPTPYISGWLYPRIVVPPEARELLTEPELKAVLAHEQAHLDHKDHWTFALLHLLGSFTVLIPPLQIVLRGIEQSLECRCDQVAAKIHGRAAVGRALAKMATLQSARLHCQPAFSASCVESRIRALRPQYKKESRPVYILALVFLGAVIL